jgi:cytochrome P450
VQPYTSEGSVLAIVSPAEHSKRRRIWDKAFTPAAVSSYQPLLQGRITEFIDQLYARVDKPLDLAEWTGLMATDFMGDFALGGIFSSMEHGADHANIHKLGTRILGQAESFGSLPWLRPIFARLAQLGGLKFRQVAAEAVSARMENGSQTRDMFYYLVRACACLSCALCTHDVESAS